MKAKLKLSAIFLLLCTMSWSQSKNDGLDGSNEFKINGLTTVIGYFEVSYDKILNDESSFGISTGFSFDDNVDYTFAIVPNYRFFFGYGPAEGFFIEANAALFSEKSIWYNNSGDIIEENDFGLGIGLAIGNKFITTKNGYVAEIFAGAGRNFITSEFAGEVYPRIGISIGKRF